MTEKRDYELNGAGRRDYDNHACPFYSHEAHNCVEVAGMKKLFYWGAGILVTIMLATWGYFAHSQDQMIALAQKQIKVMSRLETIINYKILPAIDKGSDHLR